MTPNPESAAATRHSNVVPGGRSFDLSPSVIAAFAAAWLRSNGAKYGLTKEAFFAILVQAEGKYLPADSAEQDQVQFIGSLRHEELALARACAAGHETAWIEFLSRYREKLYDAARAITKDHTTGKELADSLYADLYGTTVRGEERVSKLNFYNGRGSLEGWLRTVLAQEFVNRYRGNKRLVSLEEKTEEGVQFTAPQPDCQPNGEATSRLDSAIDEALARLAQEERLILSAYHLDGRTLAEIGRMLRLHESTISRKLEKIIGRLRDDIVKQLVHNGMDRQQAREAIDDTDVRDLSVDIRNALAQDSDTRTFLRKESDQG